MSVILTGMDMPDDCESCQYSQCDFHGMEWFSSSSNRNYSWCRAYNCPLRSVDGLLEKIRTATALRCKDNVGEVFISEKDLFEIIKEYCEMEDK